MSEDGVSRALAVFTNGFSCYSGCRQYRENIAAAQQEVGPAAPQVEKVRMFFNHPGFIETMADSIRTSMEKIPEERRAGAMILFTAHSIPLSMAENCRYESQLTEASRLVAEAVGHQRWELVYQSRSGPPQQPWLEPDVCDRIEELHPGGDLRDLIILPIGFVSDHMEVIYDLDTEAAELCEKLGISMQRAATAGCHPKFVAMLRGLIQERVSGSAERPALGCMGPSHDVCPEDCCLYTPQRPARPAAV